MSISISTQLLQGLLGEFHSRRLLLLRAPSFPTPSTAAPPNPETNHNSFDPYTGNNSLNAKVIKVLSILICTVIFSLGLNSIIRCVLRCSSLVASESEAHAPTQSANSGIKRKALKSFPTVNYSADLHPPGLDSECVICLSDFTHGDRIRILPMCNHGFHAQCIDNWLSSHSSCPKCRQCLVDNQASSSRPPPPVQETIVTVAPVEPEVYS